MTDAETEKRQLVSLSARLGRNHLFVQASTGNTSIKIDGTLWIKASGKWLAEAEQTNILLPINLASALDSVHRNLDPTLLSPDVQTGLRASIETAMHAVLPHRIVIHVHSVNALAWAIRADAPDSLSDRLNGLRWHWIPYVSSGVPLARAVGETGNNDTNIFVLGNHGLVVAGETCVSAEQILSEVDRRLAVTPPAPPQPDFGVLSEIATYGSWRLPEHPVLHIMGLDPVCRFALAGGIIIPCQAIFWRTTTPTLFTSISATSLLTACDLDLLSRPFVIIEGSGVLVRKDIDSSEYAILRGLAEVLQRISSTPVRYLSQIELAKLEVNGGNYRSLPNPHNCGMSREFERVAGVADYR